MDVSPSIPAGISRRDGAWYDLVGGEADQVAPIAHRFAMSWQAVSRLHVKSNSTGFVRIGWRIFEVFMSGTMGVGLQSRMRRRRHAWVLRLCGQAGR